MSIIADTLQRLQIHTNREKSEASDRSSIIMPGRGKREPGWHTRPSRWKFWLSGFSMFIGLSSLALGAYCIGVYWDFGLSSYASPGTGYPLSASDSAPTSEPAHSDSSSSPGESLLMPEESFFQRASVSSFLRSEEETSASHNSLLIPDSVSYEVFGPPKQENQLSAPTGNHTPVSPHETGPAPISVSQSSRSQSLPTGTAIPTRTTEYSTQQERTKKKISRQNSTLSIDPLPTSPLPVAPSEKQENSAVPLFEETPFEEEEPPGIHAQAQAEISRQSLNDFPPSPSSISEKQLSDESLEAHLITVPVSLSMEDRLRQAQQCIQSGKYEEAVSSLSPLFANPPDHWEPWFWMGTALLGQNELEQADQYFLSGLARNDKIPQLWIQRALVAHQRGEYQLAIHELRRAESLDAGLPHTYLNMGYAYEKLGNARLANEYYGRFLKASEGNPAFFLTRKKLFAHFTDQIDSTPPQTPLAPLSGAP